MTRPSQTPIPKTIGRLLCGLIVGVCVARGIFAEDAASSSKSAETTAPPRPNASRSNRRPAAKRRSQTDPFSNFMEDVQGFGETKSGLAAAKLAYNTAITFFGPESSQAALAMTGLAFSHTAQGDYAVARPLLEKAISIERKLYPSGRPVRGHQQLAVSLEVLGSLYSRNGDLARAEPLIREALELRRRLLGDDHIDVASSLNNLAILYLEMGDSAEAEALFLEELTITRKVLGPQHRSFGTAVMNLAAVYQARGDYAKAEPLLKQAVAIEKAALGAHHPIYASSLQNLAVLYCRAGDEAKAQLLFQQVLEIQKTALGREHPLYGHTLNGLAYSYLCSGEYAKAEPLLTQSLEIVRKSLGVEHPQYAGGLNNLAFLYESKGDPARAEPLLRQAVEITERHVARISGGLSERRRMRLMASLRYLLDRYLTLAFSLGMNGSHVYGHCLLWKGAAFAAASEIRVLRQNPELKSRFDEWHSVSAQLATLAFKTPGPKDRDAWSRQLSDLTEKKEAIEGDLAKRNTEFRRQKELRQLGPAELRAHLPNGTALIDFLEFTPFRPTRKLQVAGTHERHLAAFVLGPERDVAFLDLGPVDPIRRNISDWRATLGNSDSAVDAARSLKRAIWEPLARHLGDAKTVLLSPDGDLGQFPFAALPGGKQGTYLIEDINLVVVPVPRLLAAPIAARERNRDRQTAVLFGDIDFNGDPAPTRPLDSDQTLLAQATQRSALRAGELEFPPLSGTAAEIDEIAALHAEQFGPGRQKTFRGLRATEEAVRSQAPRCAYLHLATHGFFQPLDERQRQLNENRTAWSFESQEQVVEIHPGLQCGLALAGANHRQAARRPEEAPRDDGILTALEVASLDLRGVELVTLSACETGLGRTASGEGVLGLQRAFQLAGARNVVASLWKVDDQGTAALMRLFYHKLWAEKKTPAKALREAQLAILHDPGQIESLAATRAPRFKDAVKLPASGQRPSARQMASPRFWAAFTLSGESE